MRRPSTVPSTQFGGTAVTVVLVLCLAAALFLMAIHMTATIKRSRVQSAWETTLGSLEEVIERYPANETNASAHEIERIAASLGVDIVPRNVEDGVRPGEAAKDEFEAMSKATFGQYLTGMLQRPDAGLIDAPPEVLVTYVTRNEEALRELRATLAAGRTPPLWLSDISKLVDAPLPNLLGHIYLIKLMTSTALERLSVGDEQTALEYLDAGWQLLDGLRDTPVLINQLIVIAETRMLVGALRHVDDVPERWLARLDSDFRGDFLQAMKYEGWVWLFLDDEGFTDAWWQKAAKPVVKPYTTYTLADASGIWRERIENLEDVESICDYDLSAHEADMNIPIPRWNIFGEILVPNLANAIDRLARLELDVELTRLSIETRRIPPSGEITVPSRVCSKDAWTASVQDGELSIAFSRPIEWENQIGVVLPTRTITRATEYGTR